MLQRKLFSIKRYWSSILGLNYARSIWIEPEDLGKEKTLKLKNKLYIVKIPENITYKTVLRLRGLGKTMNNQTGDLLLTIWLNQGGDIQKNLWLSEAAAKTGGDKIVQLDEKKIFVVVPPNSHDGLTLRLKGLGKKRDFNWRAPLLRRKRGNLLVKLFVFPDTIAPKYGHFDMLSTDDMALEGWIYKKVDEVLYKIGSSSFPTNPIHADVVADIFNQNGWKGIFQALVNHTKLTGLNIQLAKSDTISLPGSCQRAVRYQNLKPVAVQYLITIKEQFLDNPFMVAAILAHELSHIVSYEKIDKFPLASEYRYMTDQAKLEEERTVDLIVFMYKMGEFQLRAARDERITLGYFHQELFERIQVIVSKKLK